MRIVILGFIVLVLSISSLYANGKIYNETILGKKCEVEDFNYLGDFRLPLSSSKNLLKNKIFVVKKENKKWKKGDYEDEKIYDLIYIKGNYYNESDYRLNEKLHFFDNGKKYYGILGKRNGKEVFVLNGKESQEFEEIDKVFSVGKYKFEKQIFEGKKEKFGGEIIYIKNGKEFKKDFKIINYFYINGKIYYLGSKNKKKFIIDAHGDKTKEYDDIVDMDISKDKSSYSFIGYNKNISHSIIKDGKEIIKYTKKEILYGEYLNDYSVKGLRYFDNSNISYFIKNKDNNYNLILHKEGKFKILSQYKTINNNIRKIIIDNSKNRTSFYGGNFNGKNFLIGNKLNGIKVFVFPNGEEYLLEKNYNFDSIYKNTDGKFLFVIKNKKRQFFLMNNKKKFGPYVSIILVDHSIKSGKTVFKGIKENGKEVLIFDGKEGREFDKIYLTYNFDDSAGEFSSDGLEYSYVAATKGSVGIYVSTLIKNGKEIKLYPNISYKPGIDELTYSDDGKVFAYLLRRDDGVFIVQNGKKSKLYKKADIITYNKNTKTFGLLVEKIDGNFSYIDNFKENGQFSNFSFLSLSENKEILYGIDGGYNLIVNGKIIGKDISEYEHSENGKHFIYLQREDLNNDEIYDKGKIYFDGKIFKEFNKGQFIGFTDNSKYFSFIGDKKFYKCGVEDEKIINKVLDKVTKNNNKLPYFIFFIFLFVLIFVMMKIYRKKQEINKK